MARTFHNPRPLSRWLVILSLICGIGAQVGHGLVHVHEADAPALSDCGHHHGEDGPGAPSASSGETCLGCVLANERTTAIVFAAPALAPATECDDAVVALESVFSAAPRCGTRIRGPPFSL